MNKKEKLALLAAQAADKMTGFILDMMELSKAGLIDYSSFGDKFDPIHVDYLSCYKVLFEYCLAQSGEDDEAIMLETTDLLNRHMKAVITKEQTEEFFKIYGLMCTRQIGLKTPAVRNNDLN